MSQPFDLPPPQPSHVGTVSYLSAGAVPPPSNTLGLVGFVLVMVGLVGVCFAPLFLFGLIGTILCAIAAFRVPRGLAIAGLIVGGLEVLAAIAIGSSSRSSSPVPRAASTRP